MDRQRPCQLLLPTDAPRCRNHGQQHAADATGSAERGLIPRRRVRSTHHRPNRPTYTASRVDEYRGGIIRDSDCIERNERGRWSGRHAHCQERSCSARTDRDDFSLRVYLFGWLDA